MLALRLLPQFVPGSPDARLDPVGVVLLGAGVLLVLLPLLGESGSDSDSDLAGRPWWLLAVAAVVLAGFVLWERRLARSGGAPIMDLGLFARRSYALGAGLALWYFAGFTAIFFVLTLTCSRGWVTPRCRPAWPRRRSRSAVAWPRSAVAGWWPGSAGASSWSGWC